jgi:hypothetical protein
MRLSPSIVFAALATVASAQDHRPLGFDLLDARWSEPLQRIVAIADSPSRIILLDPATNTGTTIALSRTPTKLALSADGLTAAVGHDSLISHVNLSTSTIIRTIPVPYGVVTSIALGRDWMYGRPFGSLRIATGTFFPTALPAETPLRGGPLQVDATNTWLYAGFRRHSISTGPITSEEVTVGGGLLSRDGMRRYPGGAGSSIFYRPDSTQHTWVYDTSIPTPPVWEASTPRNIQYVAESPSQLAALGLNPNNASVDNGSTIQLLAKANPSQSELLDLPRLILGQTSYLTTAQYAFFDAAGDNLYVLTQALLEGGTLGVWGLASFRVRNPEDCEATLTVPAADAISWQGGAYSLPLTSPAGCIARSTTQESWIRVGSGAASSGTRRELMVVIRPNRGSTSRSGTIRVNGRNFTLTQAAAGATDDELVRIPSTVRDTAYSKLLGALVIASGDQPELLVLTPTSETYLPLLNHPLSVGVSPNGQTVAIGHDGWVSVVDLASMQFIKRIRVPGKIRQIAVSSRLQAYALADAELFTVQLSSPEFVFSTPASQRGWLIPLTDTFIPPALEIHEASGSLYVGSLKFDISQQQGLPLPLYDKGGPEIRYWLAENGTRLVNSSGQVLLASPYQPLDYLATGSLAAADSNISSARHIVPRGSLAATVGPPWFARTNPSELQLYALSNDALTGRIRLPKMTVNGVELDTFGRNLFWAVSAPAQTPDQLLAVVQAKTPDADFKRLQALHYGYVAYRPAQSGACVSLPASSASIDAGTASGSFVVSTSSNCVWDAVSNASWLRVTSGGLSIGPGAVAFEADSNASGAARSAVVSVAGTRSFTVNQPAGPAPGVPVLLSPAAGAAGVSSSTTALTWTPGSGSTQSEVYFGTANPPPLVTTVSAGSFTPTLVPNTVYYWRIIARNASGTTASEIRRFVTAPACTFSVQGLMLPSGGDQPFEATANVVTQPGCPWTAASGLPWLRVIETSGIGARQVRMLVQPNPGPQVRVGLITVAGVFVNVRQDYTPVAPFPGFVSTVTPAVGSGVTDTFTELTFTHTWAPPFTYSTNLSFHIQDFSAGPLMTVTNVCSGIVNSGGAVVLYGTESQGHMYLGEVWSGSRENSFCFIDGVGSPRAVVTANSILATMRIRFKAPWSGKTLRIFVGGAQQGTFTVNASGSSGLTLNPSATPVPALGGSVTTTVTASSAWTAVSNDPWLTVTAGASGSGNGTVTVLAATNNGGQRSGSVTIGGQLFQIIQAAVAPEGLQLVPITPCRISDTRNPNGPLGGPALAANTPRDIPVRRTCGIPPEALAYSLNVTVVPRGTLGFITIWPTGQTRPLASTLNSLDGRIKANAALVPAGVSGAISLLATDSTDVILDVNGYFVTPQATGMMFYPVEPCRVTDTRLPGAQVLNAREQRTIDIRGSRCGVPVAAQAVSLNATVIPRGPLGFLTLWPEGVSQPVVSTLNALTGTVTANAAVVPVSEVTGAIKAFATDTTDLVLDINGYFARPFANGPGYRFFPTAPCRLSDTRNPAGPFGGPALVPGIIRDIPVTQGNCNIPVSAAYAINATVVPNGSFGYLTLWAAGAGQPVVSTLNAVDGLVSSNLAIVPAGNLGAISLFGSNAAHLVFDLSGYFAP